MGESGEGILQPVLKKEMVETGGGGGGASKYYFILSLYIIKTGLDEFSRTGQEMPGTFISFIGQFVQRAL